MPQKMTVELVDGLPTVCEPKDSDTPIFPGQVQLSTAYVPYQSLGCILDPEEALSAGTVFPELYSPAPTWGKRSRNLPPEPTLTASMPGDVIPDAADIIAML